MGHFDFHFHLLSKHAIADDKNPVVEINVKGFAGLLNDIFGGPFASQSCPLQVTQSSLRFGVIAALAVEYAFVARMLQFAGFSLQRELPLDQQMIEDIKHGRTSYFKLFEDQLRYTAESISANPHWNIRLLSRQRAGEAAEAFETALNDKELAAHPRWFALSIEGGHNLCEVLIRGREQHQTPDRTLKRLQDEGVYDFLAMNLCHLSYIPEQHLGGFAQGLNKAAQIAFTSEDFHPANGLGLTPLGRKVVRQALTHARRPVLIDVKHMSLYSRLQYYQYKGKLEEEFPDVRRLPVISSHTGFTFNTINEYIGQQQYEADLGTDDRGRLYTRITPMERRIGRTDDWINSGLHCNPWTINLFDDEIRIIMESRGLIGISLDQRVLGTENMVVDSRRGQTYESEYLSREEYERLFRDRQMPAAEGLIAKLMDRVTPPKPRERHSMLLAAHLVHAVRVGINAGLVGVFGEDDSPWDYLCIGSDFDGLINPINAVQNVKELPQLRIELRRYLPQADKTLPFYSEVRALRYDSHGRPDQAYLDEVIDKVLLKNGVRFLQRWCDNWGIKEQELVVHAKVEGVG